MTGIEDGFKDLEEYFSTRLRALKSLSDLQKRPKNFFHIEKPTRILSTKGISIKKIGKVPTDNIE